MTKDEIKALLESYKFDYTFYLEKRREADMLKEPFSKTIQILKEASETTNKELTNEIILSYTKDLLEMENKLAKLKLNLDQIESLVDKASQPNKLVLHYKYINGLTLEEIADKMNYSTQRIYQLHDAGIKEIFDNQEKEEAI